MVMGWSGLYFCVAKLEHLFGLGETLSLWVAAVDVFLFIFLSGALLLRVLLMPQSLQEELSQPVGLCASAAAAVATILLSYVFIGLGQGALGLQSDVGKQALMSIAQLLWWIGAGLELAVSVGVMVVYAKWLAKGSNSLAQVAPVMFIPAVGNVLVVLSGVALGHEAWSTLQMGLGVVLWPLVACLLLMRVRKIGPLPPLAQPSWFISLSPPSVIGLAFLALQAPILWAWVFWWVASLVLLGLMPVVWRVLHQPFSNTFWALSFPWAAWCSLSISLWGDAARGAAPNAFGVQLALVLVTVMLGGLVLWLSARSLLLLRAALRA